MVSLTEQAHQLIAEVVRPGDVVIDATAGNGHDTLFLARLVGEQGRVFAFDVQPEAIRATAARLEDAGINNVTLLQQDHAGLQDARVLPVRYRGQITAAMFNLGYLPGGDKGVTTRISSTIPAVITALAVLRQGGILTLIAYPGHPGGLAEMRQVAAVLSSLPPDRYRVEPENKAAPSPKGPRLFVVRRLAPFGS